MRRNQIDLRSHSVDERPGLIDNIKNWLTETGRVERLLQADIYAFLTAYHNSTIPFLYPVTSLRCSACSFPTWSKNNTPSPSIIGKTVCLISSTRFKRINSLASIAPPTSQTFLYFGFNFSLTSWVRSPAYSSTLAGSTGRFLFVTTT